MERVLRKYFILVPLGIIGLVIVALITGAIVQSIALRTDSKNSPPPGRLYNVHFQATRLAQMRSATFWKAMETTFPAGVAMTQEVKTATRPLGDLPLLVMSAGASAMSYCERLKMDCTATQSEWDIMQKDLVNLSTDASQVISPRASHYMHIVDPAFLVKGLSSFWHRIRSKKSTP